MLERFVRTQGDLPGAGVGSPWSAGGERGCRGCHTGRTLGCILASQRGGGAGGEGGTPGSHSGLYHLGEQVRGGSSNYQVAINDLYNKILKRDWT